MQIVIEMDEEYYHFIKRQVAHGITNPLKTCAARGIQLPKSHGRLIDAKEVYKKFYCRCLAGVAREVLDETPTIIEADRAESED